MPGPPSLATPKVHLSPPVSRTMFGRLFSKESSLLPRFVSQVLRILDFGTSVEGIPITV